MSGIGTTQLDVETLRCEVRKEYSEVARNPGKGFHFHTGRPLARILGYDEATLNSLPERSVESLAGVGNPFRLGEIRPGEKVVDLGCGAGMDSLIAARKVGPSGQVIGVDMTPEMLEKANRSRDELGLGNLEFRQAFVEALPIEDGWADVVISNGILNLVPDKPAVWREIFRVLKPGGRVQMADIRVGIPVPEEAKEDIDLWTG
jgi:SAM-dependent methyltransferase